MLEYGKDKLSIFKMVSKEEFDLFLENLRKKERIVIVEGRNDKKALDDLGVREVIYLSMPLYKVVENVIEEKKDCVILTDLDRKGKELYSKLKSELSQKGVKVDDLPRKFLAATRLRQIEGMKRFYERL